MIKTKRILAVVLIFVVMVSLLPVYTHPAEAAGVAAAKAGGKLICVILAGLGIEVAGGAFDADAMFHDMSEELPDVNWEGLLLAGGTLTIAGALWQEGVIENVTRWIMGRQNVANNTMLQHVEFGNFITDANGSLMPFVRPNATGALRTSDMEIFLQKPWSVNSGLNVTFTGTDFAWNLSYDGTTVVHGVNRMTLRMRRIRRSDGQQTHTATQVVINPQNARAGLVLYRNPSPNVGYFFMWSITNLGYDGSILLQDTNNNPWNTTSGATAATGSAITLPLGQFGDMHDARANYVPTQQVGNLTREQFLEGVIRHAREHGARDTAIDLDGLGIMQGVQPTQKEVWNALDIPIPGVGQPQPETIWEQLERLRNSLREKPGYIPDFQGLGQRMRELDELLREIGGEGQLTGSEAGAIRGVLGGVDQGVSAGTLTGAQANAFALQLEDIMQQIRARIQNQPPPGGVPPAVFSMFPFCIPWDVYNFFSAIVAQPREPVFHFVLFPSGFMGFSGFEEQSITVDFGLFETPLRIFRAGMLISFVVGLIAVTRRYIWTGGG